MYKKSLLIALVCALALLVAPAWGEDALKAAVVKIVTTDDVVLTGTLYETGGEANPAVLLLHMLGRNRGDYQQLAERLRSKGIVCLTLDLRGHGESTSLRSDPQRRLDYRQFSESEFAGLLLDVRAALSFMRELPTIDSERIAIVGASIGANAALLQAEQDGRIKALALLSPGLNYRGLKTEDAAPNLLRCKLLLAAAEDDEYSARSVRRLDELARVPTELLVYPGGGHGTTLLANRPELFNKLVEFLGSTL